MIDFDEKYKRALSKYKFLDLFAGIEDFRFHDLRHIFASRLVMAGVNIRTVQQLMGHKDIRMTMRYSHLSDAHLKEAVNKLESGTNLAQLGGEKI